MMKWKENRVVLCLALCAACLVVLAACSGNSDDTVETETTPVETTPVEEETQQTVMGQVSYVGSAYISVSVYEADGEVEDYAALDPASLTPTEQTESITTTDDTEYWKVEDGGLVQADREEITTEAMIVSTYTEDGTHQVILLAAEDGGQEQPEDGGQEQTDQQDGGQEQSAQPADGEEEVRAQTE